MKTKILLTVMCMFFFLSATFSQIPKGAVVLGGNLGFAFASDESFSSNFTQDVKQQYYLIKPSAGIAVKQNLLVGTQVHYRHEKTTYAGSYNYNINNYGLGMFVRRYKPLGKDFYAFAQLNAVGAYTNQETHYNAQSEYTISKGHEVRVSIYPGIAYNITRRIQIEAGYYDIGYLSFTRSESHTNINSITSSKGSRLAVGTSLTSLAGITLGIQFLLK